MFLLLGVKDSIIFNKICTCVNILIIAFIVICGATKADFKNWFIEIKKVITGELMSGSYKYYNKRF